MKLHYYLFLILLSIALFSVADRNETKSDYFKITKNGVWVKAGYAIQTYGKGKAVIYNPQKYVFLNTEKKGLSLILAPKAMKRYCGKNMVIVNGNCWKAMSYGNFTRQVTSVRCGAGQSIVNGRCIDNSQHETCPGGTIRVQGDCVPIDGGGQNCQGGCPEGTFCVNGQCQPTNNCDGGCPEGEMCINGQCEGAQDCDGDCEPGEICVNNACRSIGGGFRDDVAIILMP